MKAGNVKNSQMKKIAKLFLSSFLILLYTCAFGQNENQDDQAIKMLKKFYTNYNLAWATIKDNHQLIKCLDSLRNTYCTNIFYQELKREFKIDGLDHDVIIKDEYTNETQINTISIKKDISKTGIYIVTYLDSTISPSYKPITNNVTLYVRLVKINGQFKISQVK